MLPSWCPALPVCGARGEHGVEFERSNRGLAPRWSRRRRTPPIRGPAVRSPALPGRSRCSCRRLVDPRLAKSCMVHGLGDRNRGGAWAKSCTVHDSADRMVSNGVASRAKAQNLTRPTSPGTAAPAGVRPRQLWVRREPAGGFTAPIHSALAPLGHHVEPADRHYVSMGRAALDGLCSGSQILVH